MTPATADVLEVLLDAGEPVWGLKIVKVTRRPAGSVYPILERLERLGWTTSQWDEDNDRAGPRRRLYLLSDEARASALTVVAGVRDRQARLSAHAAAARA
ncbi:helix-turn-helix transcriptional regulator [Cryobacterium sp. TmT3-12]|nr:MULTISPECIES: helix-turn-helix transcriptional regulator [Cryobacterium]